MKSVNIKLKLSHFMMKIIKMLYLSSVKNNEIICSTNSTLSMFKTTNSVNVIKISDFKKNKCVFDES